MVLVLLTKEGKLGVISYVKEEEVGVTWKKPVVYGSNSACIKPSWIRNYREFRDVLHRHVVYH